MSEQVQLLHPPLREAVINLRLEEQLSGKLIEELKDKRLPNYERVGPLKRGTFRFEIGAEAPSQASVTRDELDGWRFQSTDGSKVVQIRRNGLTYSVLRDYRTWEEFKSGARMVWDLLREWFGQLTVARVAVRYINVLQLPPGLTDFDEYLRAGPRIPPEVPQVLSGFFHRVQVPFSELGAFAIITQALEPPTQTAIPVILDIDVQGLVKKGAEPDDIWTELDKLRKIKNLIFFSSITERVLELCQ